MIRRPPTSPLFPYTTLCRSIPQNYKRRTGWASTRFFRLVGIVTIKAENQAVSPVPRHSVIPITVQVGTLSKPPTSTLGKRRPRYTSRRKAGAHGFVSHCTVRTFLNARSSLRAAPDGTYPLVYNPRPWGVTRVVWPLLNESGWHLLPGYWRLFLSPRLGERSKRILEPFISVDTRPRPRVSEAFAEVGISSGSLGQLWNLCRCAVRLSLPVARVARVR